MKGYSDKGEQEKGLCNAEQEGESSVEGDSEEDSECGDDDPGSEYVEDEERRMRRITQSPDNRDLCQARSRGY